MACPGRRHGRFNQRSFTAQTIRLQSFFDDAVRAESGIYSKKIATKKNKKTKKKQGLERETGIAALTVSKKKDPPFFFGFQD